MSKIKVKKIVKKTVRIFVAVVTAVIMTGVGNLLPGMPSILPARAAVTTKTVTGLTTWNQVVTPDQTLAVFGLNLVGNSGESLNSIALQIMGPASSLVALSGTASASGVKIYKDSVSGDTNGVYDSNDTLVEFTGTAPSWDSNTYEATFGLVPNVIPTDDADANDGNDYFVVITTKPAAQILSSSMFGFEIDVGGVGVTGDSNVPNSRVEANHVSLDAGIAVINEIVTDPQLDWSVGDGVTPFSGTPGAASGTNDEWVEIYIKQSGLNVSTWTIAVDNKTGSDTDFSGSVSAAGSFGTLRYVTAGSGTPTNTEAGDYYVLGDLSGSAAVLEDDLQITLTGSSGVVDVVTLGSFDDGSTWDNGPVGTANDSTDESVGRDGSSGDMDYDSDDFSHQTATPGAVNNTPPIPMAANLSDSDPMRHTVVVNFSETVTIGSAQTVGNYLLTTQSSSTPISATWGDTSAPAQVTLVFAETITANTDQLQVSGVQDAGGLSGTYRKIEIYGGGPPGGDDAVGPQMLINEVVTNPYSDWSLASYSGTSQDSNGAFNDEYIEILINRNNYDLTGTTSAAAWTMRIFNDNYNTVHEGNLADYDATFNPNGLFATVYYIASATGTASSTATGDFLVLGDLQPDNMSDNIKIELESPFGVFVDQVTIGDFNDGYTGDNTAACVKEAATESIGRNSIGAETGDDSVDFGRQAGTPGATNAGFTSNIAISSVTINSPTELSIDFTEAVTTEIATTNAAKYFDISPSITMSSSSISSAGSGRFVTVTLATAMTNQSYTFTVSKNNSITNYGTDGTDGSETITATDYTLQGMAQDLAAPQISGVNVISGTEIEVLFTEDNGINIYGADDTAGGTDANADAVFQFSPGLGAVTAQSMWDRVNLTTATAQTSGTTYTVTISNLRDRAMPTANVLSSNSHSGTTDNQTTFTGYSTSSDGESPYIIGSMPSMNESDVPINTKRLRVGFSEPMNPSSLTFTRASASSTADNVMLGKVSVSDWSLDASNLVALASVVYDSTNESIEIAVPSTTTLTASIPYMLFLRGDNNGTQTGISDVSGTEMTWDYQTSFWTAAGADTTKPQVSSTNIDAEYSSYTGVPVGLSAITIYFSEAMNPSTIIDENTADSSNNITLTYSSGGSDTKVAGTINYNIMGRSAEFMPSSALNQNTQYTLSVTTGVTDTAGNALNSQFIQVFTTGGADSTLPTIDFADSGGYMIWVQFSEPVQAAQATNLSAWTLVSGGSTVSLSSAQAEYYSWDNGLEIRGLSLTAGDSFTVTAPSTLADLAGNAIGSTNNTYTGTVFNMDTWNEFPMMTESYPYQWASGVPVAVTLSANFSEALDAASVHSDAYGPSESDTVRLYKVVDGIASTTLIAGTSTYYSSSKTITFAPTANLKEDQDYKLVIGMDCAPGESCDMTQSIRDEGGVNVPYPFFIDFRTGAGTDTTAPTLSSSNPSDGDGVGGDTNDAPVGLGAVSLFFDEALNPSTLTNTNILFATTGDITYEKRYIPGTIDYMPMGYMIDFKPSAVLTRDTSYTLRLAAGVTDASGNAITQTDITFETVDADDTTNPYVDFSTGDPFGLFIKFTEPVTQTSAENIRNYTLISCPAAQDLDTGADVYTVSLQGKNPEYHFMDNSVYIPNLNLTAGNKYRVTVTNVTDLAGNSITTTTDENSSLYHRTIEAGNLNYNQHEGNIFDMTFMDDTVYAMYTFPNEWNVPTGSSKVKIGFSEALDNTTVDSDSILVIPMASGAYSDANNISDDGGVSITWNSDSNEVIVSGVTLTADTEYKVKVTTAVADGGGNTMMSWNPWDASDDTAYESFFKTAATAGNDNTAPQVWGTNLEQYTNVRGNIVGVPLWFGTIDVMFSEQMDEDTVRAVDAAASSTIYVSGATTTVAADPGTADTTLTLGAVTELSTSSRIMITETGLTTVYAEVLALNTATDLIEINKALGTDFTTGAIVTRVLKGFVDYDPWDKSATFISEEPLGQNKVYRLIIRNRAQDITGNNMSADVSYKFTTENSADTTNPKITFAEAESFELRMWFNEPLKKSLAENVRNYTFESPIGKVVNLDGKTIEYNPMEHGVFIRGLTLTGDNTFRVTVSTRVTDLTDNAISTATSTDGRPETDPNGGGEIPDHQYEGYVMAHFEDFFDGKAKTDFTQQDKMFDHFMNAVQVMPMNPMVGKTTNYFVNFPVTSAIPNGGQIVIKFPEGFDLSAADTMNVFDSSDPDTWGPNNSPMNNDLNGWSGGTVSIASVSTSSAARTLTITTGGATTTAQDFISVDLRGIKNPSSPHESPDYTASISTKDTGGEPVEGPFNSQPIFIQPKGSNTIRGTVTLPDATADEEILVELHGPAGMQQQVLIINDDKENDNLGATSTEAAGKADYRFADLPNGGYDISVMNSDFSPMIMIDSGGQQTEYFSPMMHEMIWVESSETATSDIVMIKSSAGGDWVDDWGTSRTMRTMRVIVTGEVGMAQKRAEIAISGPGQFFGKEINFDSAGNASTTVTVPEDMYWVDVHPYMPMMMFTQGPPPPPPFAPPPGKNVFVNNKQDGSETGVDETTFELAGRSADYYLEVTVRDNVNEVGINGAEVFAHNPMGFGVPPVRTNSNGTTTIKLPAGVYMVGTMVPGLPPTPEKSVVITSDSTSTNAATLVFDVKVDLDNSFTIQGSVKDADGNLQVDVPVWADERSSADAVFLFGHIFQMTNSEGKFKFRVPENTTWQVQANIPGYGETDRILIQGISANRTGVNLTPKTELATLSGTITVNATSVSAAHVFAEGISGTTGFYGVDTASDGTYSLKVSEGTYKVGVYSPEFGEQVLSSSQAVTEAQATGTATIVMANPNIGGGANARTLTIEFRDSSDASTTPEEVFIDIRDSSGNGVFEAVKAVDTTQVKLPEGTYSVEVYTPETGALAPITSIVIDGAVNANEAGTDRVAVTIVDHVEITGKIYQDANSDGNYDATEELDSAFVTAFSETTGKTVSTRTATSGVYVLKLPPNDTYKIAADKLDYIAVATQEMTVTTTNVAGTENDYALDAKDENLKITGTVYFDSATSSNLADNVNKKAKIWAETDDGRWQSADVEADGTYTMYVTAGDWTVQAAGHGGYETVADEILPVTVTNAEVPAQNFIMDPISGYVQGESNATPFKSKKEGRAYSADNAVMVHAPPDSIENSETSADISIDIKPTSNVPEKINKVSAAGDGTPTVTNPISPMVDYAHEIAATVDGESRNNLDGDVQVKFSYADYSATDKAAIEADPTIFKCQFLNEAGQWQPTDVSIVDTTNELLVCPTDHFSTYAPSLPTNILAPATTTGVAAAAGSSQNVITWTQNTEADMSHYIVWETEVTEGQVTTVQDSTCSASSCSYTHTGLTNGTTYGYQILAVDTSGFTAAGSLRVTAAPAAAATETNQIAHLPAVAAATTYGSADTTDTTDTAEPEAETVAAEAIEITAAAGGTVEATTDQGTTAALEMPANAVTADAVVDIAPTQTTAAAVSQQVDAVPASKSVVGGYVYDYSVSVADEAVSMFEEAVTISFTYTDTQVSSLDEDSLIVAYYNEDSSSWIELETTVDKANKKVTAQVTHLTLFALLGEESEVSAAPSTKPITEMTIPELKAEIARIAALIAELQQELLKLIGTGEIAGVPATFKFETTLKKGMVNNDVKYMQIVLNSDPATQLAISGVGSSGEETNIFGSLTKAAVIKFQEKYATSILAPWNLTTGTGLVGSTTRGKLNELLGK